MSSVKLVSLQGSVRINGDIHTGMVVIGGRGNAHYEKTTSGCVWANRGGECVFSDKLEFCKGCSIEIGRFGHLVFDTNIYFGPSVRISCFDRIEIGSNSRIAWECIIMDTDFHSIINVNTGKRGILTSPIKIGRNNWIGMRCFVLKGTSTSNYSVFSASSMLNKKYEDGEYCLYGGTPAKKIKDGIFRDLSSNVLYNFYILNAVGFGGSLERNQAIKHCITKNLISSIALDFNGKYIEDAIKYLSDNEFVGDVGIELNYSSMTAGSKGTEEIIEKTEQLLQNIKAKGIKISFVQFSDPLPKKNKELFMALKEILYREQIMGVSLLNFKKNYIDKSRLFKHADYIMSTCEKDAIYRMNQYIIECNIYPIVIDNVVCDKKTKTPINQLTFQLKKYTEL